MLRLNKKLNPEQRGYESERLNEGLRKRIVGQEEAINQVVNMYQMFLSGMSTPGRPIGNFLFLGPTGTGKTRMVEATAEALLGDPRAVIKIDCAEFQHSHEIAKLIGSPPGYLGHRETHPLLSQEVLNQYHTDKLKVSFVLFDEIEKASDALWNLLLGILDKATLTLGDNRRVDFSRAMIFMTSNLGVVEMNSIVRPNLGFAPSEGTRERRQGHLDNGLGEKIAQAGIDAARRKFPPEFMNRIDKTIVFRSLESEQLHQILNIELGMMQQRVFNSANATPFVFQVSDEVKSFILSQGTDLKYGARHLKRAIDRLLVHPLSNLIASDQIRGGDFIQVDFHSGSNELSFIKRAEELPAYAMIQMVDGRSEDCEVDLTPPGEPFSGKRAPNGAKVAKMDVANAKSQRNR